MARTLSPAAARRRFLRRSAAERRDGRPQASPRAAASSRRAKIRSRRVRLSIYAAHPRMAKISSSGGTRALPRNRLQAGEGVAPARSDRAERAEPVAEQRSRASPEPRPMHRSASNAARGRGSLACATRAAGNDRPTSTVRPGASTAANPSPASDRMPRPVCGVSGQQAPGGARGRSRAGGRDMRHAGGGFGRRGTCRRAPIDRADASTPPPPFRRWRSRRSSCPAWRLLREGEVPRDTRSVNWLKTCTEQHQPTQPVVLICELSVT